MFLIRRPAPKEIDRFLARQEQAKLSYEPVGLALQSPPGFTVDYQRVRIGRGAAAFAAAREALFSWRGFRLGWVELHPPGAPVVQGTNLAILAHHAGLWSLNACRVTFRLPEVPDTRRAGFAYGTLGEHAECGEELFAVELDPADDSVWYEIRAVARPCALLARLGYPVTRRFQARFRRDSARAMKATVDEAARAAAPLRDVQSPP
jgi:uncharacterized protein (UPF0548 family)